MRRLSAAYFRRTLRSFTPDEELALAYWTTDQGCRAIQGVLRETRKSDEVTDQRIKLIMDALYRNRLPHDTRLYRRTSPQFFDGSREDDVLASVGKVLEVDGFISTAVRRRDLKPEYGTILVIVNAPSGTPAAYIEPLSIASKGDNEVLLGRGQRFTISRAERKHGELAVTINLAGME